MKKVLSTFLSFQSSSNNESTIDGQSGQDSMITISDVTTFRSLRRVRSDYKSNEHFPKRRWRILSSQSSALFPNENFSSDSPAHASSCVTDQEYDYLNLSKPKEVDLCQSKECGRDNVRDTLTPAPAMKAQFSFLKRFRGEICNGTYWFFQKRKSNRSSTEENLFISVSELKKIVRLNHFARGQPTCAESQVIFYSTPNDAPQCDYCLLFTQKEYVVNNLTQIAKALSSYTLDGNTSEKCFSLSILQWKKVLSLRITLRAGSKLRFYKAMILLHNATAAGCPDLPFPENVLELTDAQKKYLLYLTLVDILGSFDNCLHDNIFPVHNPSIRDQVWKVHTESVFSFLFGRVNEDYIYSYFGGEIAFYFSWMNHYSRWLLCGSFVGLLFKIVKDLIPSSSTIRAFINPVYALVVIIGGVICIKVWERRVETLFMRYRLFHNLHRDEKNWQYRGERVLDTDTGVEKLSYPSWKRFFIFQPISWIIVIVYVAFTFLITVCSANLDLIIHKESWLAIPSFQHFASPGELCGPDSPLYWLPVALYFFSTLLLSNIFCSLARKLTEMENYEYRGDFIRALTQKRLALESVNRYSKLLLVLFVTQSKEMVIKNIKVIFIVEEILRIFVETVRPVLTHSWAEFPVRRKKGISHVKKLDETLPFYEVYQDFIEMAIQLGYIVLFTSAYPIAPTVAALAQFVELKGDLFTLCYSVRRPVPRYGTRQLATWCDVFRLLVVASVFTNTFLFVFCGSGNAGRVLLRLISRTSEENSETQLTSAIILFVAIEHLLVLVCLFLYWRIPCQPKEVKDYVAKKRVAQRERKGYTQKCF